MSGRRGFTLLETMVAAAIGIAVLAGTLTVGLQLQRQGLFEEQKTITQDSASAMRAFLAPMVLRAGSGLGNSRINLGADYAFPVNVTTDADFSADSTFAGPPAAYADRLSDALDLFWGSSEDIIPNVDCNGSGEYRSRTGSEICVRGGAYNHLVNGLVFISNPELGVSCLHTVDQVPSADRIQTTPGHGGSTPPADEPCGDATSEFWGTPGGQLLPMRGATLRVNWRSGAPVLEYDPDGRVGPLPFQEMSRGIERIKFRLGIRSLNVPDAPLVWYPDAAAGRPAIDECAAATCDVPDTGVAPGLSAAELATELAGIANADDRVRARLMRRVRVVEMTVTARSPRSDADRVQTDGTDFETDEDGQLRDGFSRRAYTVQLTPRNFTLF